MFLDAQNQYSDAQALVATAVSTNIIDHGSDRDLGIGEAMTVVIILDVASDGTTGDETYAVDLQTDDNSGFASPATVASLGGGIPRSSPVGSRFYIGLPPTKNMERFTRLNYTLGGTTPIVTVTSGLIPLRGAQAENVYAGGFLVS